MNKTELKAMGAVSPDLRMAYLHALAEIDGQAVVPAIAQMLEFDTYEPACGQLRKRAQRYPKPVARYVVFYLSRTKDAERYNMALSVLRAVPDKDLAQALEAVGRTLKGYSTGEWDYFVRKVKRDLTVLKRRIAQATA